MCNEKHTFIQERCGKTGREKVSIKSIFTSRSHLIFMQKHLHIPQKQTDSHWNALLSSLHHFYFWSFSFSSIIPLSFSQSSSETCLIVMLIDWRSLRDVVKDNGEATKTQLMQLVPSAWALSYTCSQDCTSKTWPSFILWKCLTFINLAAPL